MKKPGIKRYYQVYKYNNEKDIYIGVGLDKHKIENPTAEMEKFLAVLNGTKTEKELLKEFKKGKEWLNDLAKMNLLEDFAKTPSIDPYLAKRYNRQIAHFDLYDRPGFSAEKAQEKLSKSRVVVLGAGAGGTTLLRFLNAVGIGTLEALDFDSLSLDNLPTHTTMDEEDVGSLKLEALRRHLFRQNSRTKFIEHHGKIESSKDIVKIVKGADFFCVAYDRPRVLAAKWANEAGLLTGVPFSSIGVTDKGARCGLIVDPGKTACFECIGVEDLEFVRPSETAALMGTMVAMLASTMVHEIVKVITGYAPSRLMGTTLYINTETLEYNFINHRRKPNCICSKIVKNASK